MYSWMRLGVAIGSIGQMDGQFEFIENVTAERVTCIGSQNAAYIKTWTVTFFPAFSEFRLVKLNDIVIFVP